MRRLIRVEERLKRGLVAVELERFEGREVHIEVYADASLGNMRGEKTQIGYMVRLRDGRGNTGPILWKSKVVKRITRSTLDVETLAMEEGLESGMWIGKIWGELYGEEITVVGYTDSMNLNEPVQSLKSVENKKREKENPKDLQ